ncbi:unnamed protein product [Symbiodinium sp. CCMP2456]|nr:unnamed protein product [Symbiodinium sp. CCMP2456]
MAEVSFEAARAASVGGCELELPEAFARLKAAQIEDLANAVGGQRSEACLQYQIDSGVAASMASVITCSVMIARQEPRAAAHLWQVDWQVLAKELQPSEEVGGRVAAEPECGC